MQKQETIQIVLPSSLSEAILSLPAIWCLKQLQQKNGLEQKTIIYPPDRLVEIIWALKIFETNLLEEVVKVHSWIMPSDKAFFLDSSTRGLGLRSKNSFGYKLSNKLHANHKHHLPCLRIEEAQETLPSELIVFLQNKFGLSLAAIKYFGILLALNYSLQEIKNCFQFDSRHSLGLQIEELNTWKPTAAKENYLVLCLEASYGKNKNKLYPSENFFALAEEAYNQHKLISVFIGVDDKPALPKDKPYFVDLRHKLTLLQVAQLIKYSKGFIGNDSGPLHLANLMKKNSLCVHPATNREMRSPIFPQLNRSAADSTNLQNVLSELANMLS